MKSALGVFLGFLPFLVLVAVVGGFVYSAIQRDRAEVERRQQSDRAVEASRVVMFARGKLGDMLTLCNSGFENLGFRGESAALAWTRQGLDAYFNHGSDASTLRRVRCDASGVTIGPCFNHPLHEQLPAEAPTKSEQETSSWQWRRAVEEESSKPLDGSLVAVELLKHPVTGRVLSRRWLASPQGASAVVEPADAPAFALLLSPGQLHPLPGAAPPAAPIPRRRWALETETAFAFLEKEIPQGARISELRLEDDKLEVRIEHPTPAFDGAPPAAYGDKDFDEYGVADVDWWYPRPESGFGCKKGATLQDVHAQFIAANTNVGRLAWAWFGCSTAYSNGRSGVWHLVPAS